MCYSGKDGNHRSGYILAEDGINFDGLILGKRELPESSQLAIEMNYVGVGA